MNLRQHKRRAMPKDGSSSRWVGRRCRDYMPSCAVCDYWAFKDESGRFPYSHDELWEWQKAKGYVSDERGSLVDLG